MSHILFKYVMRIDAFFSVLPVKMITMKMFSIWHDFVNPKAGMTVLLN